MNNKNKGFFSLTSLIFSIFLLAYVGTIFYPRWQKGGTEAQLSWDAGGYYWYLPAFFIYKDWKKQEFRKDILEKYQPTPSDDFQYASIADSTNGNYVIRYTMGTAILEAPFFVIAHLLAKPLGYPPDGFSTPYQFMIYLGGLLFAILGLVFFRRFLKFYFNDYTVGIVILLLVVGTNYLNYAGVDVGMTHTWLFTLYVFVLYFSHLFYQTKEKKYIYFLSVLIGFIGLVRPPEVIACLIPIFWGLDDLRLSTLYERWKLWKRNFRPILLGVLICGAILFSQFIYWKAASGHWFVYTYGDQGFSWRSPHLRHYALNFQTGWLRHTPLMSFVIVGVLPFLFIGKNRFAVLIFAFINYYIVAAWDLWEYGGRAMVQSYPVLLIILAVFIEWLLSVKILFILATPFLLLFSYYNIWWTYQAHAGEGLVGGSPATETYYYNTLLRYHVPPDYQKMRDNIDYYLGDKTLGKQLYSSLEDTLAEPSYTLNAQNEIALSIPIQSASGNWLSAEANFYTYEINGNLWRSPIFVIRLMSKGAVVQENLIRTVRFLKNGKSIRLSIDANTHGQDIDTVELFLKHENEGKNNEIEMSNITIISYP